MDTDGEFWGWMVATDEDITPHRPGRGFAALCCLPTMMMPGCADTEPAARQTPGGEESPGFARDIEAILSKYCFECHGGDDDPEAGLDSRSVGSILSGGESGPAIVPGDPEKSLLLDMIQDEHMPPEGDLLTTEHIELVRQWIASGARP